MDVEIGDKQRNLDRISASMRETASHGAKLTVFPECALTGYCFDSLDEARPHAETIPGPFTDEIGGLCRELDAFVVAGMLECREAPSNDGNRVFNASVLIGPAGLIGAYRKVHLPFLGIDRFACPGDRPFAVHDAGELRLGMNICYDGSFPEASRVMALDGADLIVLPTNWPPAAQCFAEYVINARALENHVWYMSVNRVGEERGVRFVGASRICHPTGKTLVSAGQGEEIIYADIDPTVARNKHLVRVPGVHEIDRIKDRRPEFYGPIVAPVEP
jgi:predicted amidohydrolase